MKKLLLVLLVVALASFLFVGCLPTTPAEGEGEGEGEGEVGICPTVSVTSQVEVAGKTYIKAGKQTVTVTFAVPTEPVSVYVGSGLKTTALPGDEIVMYPNADKTVYTGTFVFGTAVSGDPSALTNPCGEAYIYVETCETCAYCKYPYKVDGVGPASKIEISAKVCSCSGIDLFFKTPTITADCSTPVCCGDKCSGFGSYAIDLYASDPFDKCCDVPCITPAYSCPAGVACPIDCTLSCVAGGVTDVAGGVKTYYAVATLLDNVGNRTRYYATITLDTDSIVSVVPHTENLNPSTGVWCTTFDNVSAGAAVTPVTTYGVDYYTIGDCYK